MADALAPFARSVPQQSCRNCDLRDRKLCQILQRQRSERVVHERRVRAGQRSFRSSPGARGQQIALRRLKALVRATTAFFFTTQGLPRTVTLPEGCLRFLLPLRRILLGLAQAVGILICRIALKCFQSFPGSNQTPLRMLVVGDGLGLVGLSGHQCRTRLVAVLTGVVKTGLSLSQLSRLSARQRARVCPVPLLEMLNGALQLACFVQLDAIFFQLVQ